MEELTKNQSKRCRACAFGEVVNESTVFCPVWAVRRKEVAAIWQKEKP